MWIAKELKKSRSQNAVVSADMRQSAIIGDYAENSPRYLFPYGMYSVPKEHENVILLDTGKGRVCAGVVGQPKGILAGEILLESASGAFIKLQQDGCVVINGLKISPNGQLAKEGSGGHVTL